MGYAVALVLMGCHWSALGNCTRVLLCSNDALEPFSDNVEPEKKKK
jgi:hypothetical protein